jgi:cation:H+ antiporter
VIHELATDLFGSTLANMVLLALLDLVYQRRNVLDTVSPDHALVGTVAILVTTIAAAAIASGGWGHIGHVGVETVIIVAVYLLRTCVVPCWPMLRARTY